MMTDSFTTYKKKAEKQWVLEWAAKILKYQSYLSVAKREHLLNKDEDRFSESSGDATFKKFLAPKSPASQAPLDLNDEVHKLLDETSDLDSQVEDVSKNSALLAPSTPLARSISFKSRDKGFSWNFLRKRSSRKMLSRIGE
jgi:hypothetical protein